MYKLIYVQEQKDGLPGPPRLLAIFDTDCASEFGHDDADYSLIDDLIQRIRSGGDRVLEVERHSLDGISAAAP